MRERQTGVGSSSCWGATGGEEEASPEELWVSWPLTLPRISHFHGFLLHCACLRLIVFLLENSR